jgi:hypothetical protein
MKQLLRTGAIALTAALAACGSDPTSTAITPITNAIVNADVASVATDVTSQKIEVMRGPGGMWGFGLRADPGKFECTGAARENLTVTRSCVFKDAAGATQTAYDAQTTATATVTTAIKGSTERGHFSATIDRTGTFTASGLAGANTSVTWNGSSAGTSTRVREKDEDGDDDAKARQYDVTHSATWTNVVVPSPRTENSWPTSGTVKHTMVVKITGGPDDGKTTTREIVITFNGTAKPTATLNGEAYELDLANRGRPRRRP